VGIPNVTCGGHIEGNSSFTHSLFSPLSGLLRLSLFPCRTLSGWGRYTTGAFSIEASAVAAFGSLAAAGRCAYHLHMVELQKHVWHRTERVGRRHVPEVAMSCYLPEQRQVALLTCSGHGRWCSRRTFASRSLACGSDCRARCIIVSEGSDGKQSSVGMRSSQGS
jgi:hypothetical protein